MKIIVCGAGRIGGSVAAMLCHEGHDVSIIERNSETIERVSNDIDALCIEGSATNPDVLADAGAADADILLAVTEQDEVNLVCAAAARSLGTKSVVARVRDPEYLGKAEFLEKVFGISVIFNPDYESAMEIARILKFPGAARVDMFSKGKMEIVAHKVMENGKISGVALKDLKRIFGAEVLVSLVQRDGKVIIPNGDFVIAANDRLSLTGHRDEVLKFFVNAGAYRKPVRSVMIFGGNRISIYLSQLLLKNGISVCIVEKDRARCESIYDLLPSAEIVCGDATRSEVLLEEGLRSKDAFVAVSSDDGDNIITSVYAKHCGVGNIVTRVNHEHFTDVLNHTELNCLITPKKIIAGQIVRYVRALADTSGNEMITLYSLAEGKAEAIEFKVNENSKCTGKPLKELKLKKNILITGIIRGSETILPNGGSVMLPGDNVVVISTTGIIRELKDILDE